MLSVRDSNPGVERNDAGGVRNPRADAELADLGVISGELGQADKHFAHRIDIGRRFAAVSLE